MTDWNKVAQHFAPMEARLAELKQTVPAMFRRLGKTTTKLEHQALGREYRDALAELRHIESVLCPAPDFTHSGNEAATERWVYDMEIDDKRNRGELPPLLKQ